ncbi:hypothetical protein C923_04009, partial [Plasmodium falciparum UGT5.1]
MNNMNNMSNIKNNYSNQNNISNNNYTYMAMQKYERDNGKAMDKSSEYNRRNRSMSACINDEENKNSYNVKNEQIVEDKGYALRSRNVYTLKNLVHKKDADIYDRGLYTCR